MCGWIYCAFTWVKKTVVVTDVFEKPVLFGAVDSNKIPLSASNYRSSVTCNSLYQASQRLARKSHMLKTVQSDIL